MQLPVVGRPAWCLILSEKKVSTLSSIPIIGEPVFPHMYLYNAAQMNVGKVGADGPVDQWHFDSVNYVAVTLLSDITDMKVSFCHMNTLK